MSILKDLAREKLPRQRILKEQVAIALLESNLEYYFLFNEWPNQI